MSRISKLRITLDLVIVGVFIAALSQLVLIYGRSVNADDSQVSLQLTEGKKQYGIYLNDKRIGSAISETKRETQHWKLSQQLSLTDEPLANLTVILREDLSLDGFGLDLNLKKLPKLPGMWSTLSEARAIGSVSVKGDCRTSPGSCRVRGTVADIPFNQKMPVGTGPVVSSAIYPLLARGVLGDRAELMMFDPLTMGRREVIYQILSREMLTLRSGKQMAIQVRQEIGDLISILWLSEKGEVLKEQLPLGLMLEFENMYEN